MTAVDPGPLPPSYAELEAGILAFADEWFGPVESVATPADFVLLQLAQRLLAIRQKAAICSLAGSTAVFPPETTGNP